MSEKQFKFSGTDRLAIGYYANKLSARTMEGAKNWPRGGKKKDHISPSEWTIMSNWLSKFDLEPVQEGNYEDATARLKELISVAHHE